MNKIAENTTSTQFSKPKSFAPGPDILVTYEGFLRMVLGSPSVVVLECVSNTVK
jgi:hypothetical protein